MSFKWVIFVMALATCACAQDNIVPILRQINRANDDGSYTYGFEAADGSFKIETRDNDGNVKGKYGYVDETKQIKVVEYAAGKEVGFDATGAHLPKPVVALPVPAPQVAPVPSRVPLARTLIVEDEIIKPEVTTEQTWSGNNIAILRSISRVNDDGSYTYGYEAEDRSFKIETRTKDGEVTGKYGYVDEAGELKVFVYTAGKDSGFEVSA